MKNLQKVMNRKNQFMNNQPDYNPFSRFNNPSNFKLGQSYNNFDDSTIPRVNLKKYNSKTYSQSNLKKPKISNSYYSSD